MHYSDFRQKRNNLCEFFFEANHISVCIIFHLVHYLNKSVCSAHYFWFEACQICQMWPGLHCTIALGPCSVSIHFLFSNKEWELHWLPMQRNSTHILHAWTLPLQSAKVFMIWLWKPYAPNKRTRGVFFFILHFHSCLVGCMTINYALQVQIGVQLLLIDYGNN